MQRIDLETTDSTSSHARRLISADGREPLVVTAREQTAGRGRHGRTWHSPPGGAWFTVAWPLPQRRAGDPCGAPQALPLTVAAALHRAVLDVAPELVGRLAVKWPNDLLLDDRKLAGVLCEQVVPAGASPAAVLIGVGLNVDLDVAELPGPLRRPAVSLSTEVARTVLIDDVIEAAIRRLLELLSQDEGARCAIDTIAYLRENLAHRGLWQRWQVGDHVQEGRVVDLDEAGRLVVAGHEGMRVLSSGELIEGES